MYLNCPQTTLLSRCQCFFLPSHTFDLSTATFYTQSMLCPCPCHVTFPNHYPARALRALGLFNSNTGRRCPHSGVGEDFSERRPGSPHENGRNSETKSRTIDPKVPKRNQRRGLRAPLCQKTGSHTKKINFGPKSGFFGPKKKLTFRH